MADGDNKPTPAAGATTAKAENPQTAQPGEKEAGQQASTASAESGNKANPQNNAKKKVIPHCPEGYSLHQLKFGRHAYKDLKTGQNVLAKAGDLVPLNEHQLTAFRDKFGPVDPEEK